MGCQMLLRESRPEGYARNAWGDPDTTPIVMEEIVLSLRGIGFKVVCNQRNESGILHKGNP